MQLAQRLLLGLRAHPVERRQISCSIAVSICSVIVCVSAFMSAENVRRTNSCPSASPRLRSTCRVQRLPARRHARNSAQRRREEVELRLLERHRQRRRLGRAPDGSADKPRSASSGSVVSSVSTAFINSGCDTFSDATPGNALHRQSKPPSRIAGRQPAQAPPRVILWYTLCGSRRSTRVSDAFASAVSMRITASASAFARASGSRQSSPSASRCTPHTARAVFTLFASVFR